MAFYVSTTAAALPCQRQARAVGRVRRPACRAAARGNVRAMEARGRQRRRAPGRQRVRAPGVAARDYDDEIDQLRDKGTLVRSGKRAPQRARGGGGGTTRRLPGCSAVVVARAASTARSASRIKSPALNTDNADGVRRSTATCGPLRRAKAASAPPHEEGRASRRARRWHRGGGVWGFKVTSTASRRAGADRRLERVAPGYGRQMLRVRVLRRTSRCTESGMCNAQLARSARPPTPTPARRRRATDLGLRGRSRRRTRHRLRAAYSRPHQRGGRGCAAHGGWGPTARWRGSRGLHLERVS